MGIGKLVAGDPAGAVIEIREVLEAAERIEDPELMEYGITAARLMGDEQLTARPLRAGRATAR